MRVYLKKTVLEAVNERLDYVFDHFEEIITSVSGGKDSTLLFHLARLKALERGRKIHAFFLDQEAEYQATIDIITEQMSYENVIPHWFQVPLRMTSVVSYEQDFLYAWGPGEEWMREKHPLAIHQLDATYPQRFYPFIDWFEKQWGEGACFLVGLRAEESLHRYRAVIKNPGYRDVLWSTGGAAVKFYPIYDWSFDDIFYHFYINNIPYNRIYDFMHSKDESEHVRLFRVSFLLHERSYKALGDLQEFEPDTYERLIRRLKGARTAARYVSEAALYNANALPERFPSWRAYRDHLLQTAPGEHRERFLKRWAKQADNEATARQQCRQLMINDWENNLPVQATKKDEDWRQKWWDIL